MKAHLVGHAKGSGLGFSVLVEVVSVDPDNPDRRPGRCHVQVRLPNGELETFQARDLATEAWDAFDPEAARRTLGTPCPE